ncbi:putative beta-lysine N-acetyltransferase [Maridesulfovibrio sp.]|uniref:putative beta-lysine N-acetyltransferase n=1 Tax=Maridesulfovibrio sp. TaxID=2795000 RepID=UPI002A18DE68|nr:putative beta-lysine N-acetyltransferase [Maridesulfovibrio sp.]
MSHDSVFLLGRSCVQCGPFNDRIYLMSLFPEDGPGIVDELFDMAASRDLSKIFAKVPRSLASPFVADGFEMEAEVPGMYPGEDGVFMSFYRRQWRKELENGEELDKVLAFANAKKGKGNVSTLPSFLSLRSLGPADAAALAGLYGRIFDTYPFPVDDPEFLRMEMAGNVRFKGVFRDGTLVGAASAEIGPDGHSAEMTDFAVEPSCRNTGIAGELLRALEKDCAEFGINCFYTIARACSYGINSLFSKGGYEFSGQLINNTNIGGSLESMNVWYRLP